MADVDFLDMSDDEISGMSAPPEPENQNPETEQVTEQVQESTDEPVGEVNADPSGSDAVGTADSDTGDAEDSDLNLPDDQLDSRPRGPDGKFLKQANEPVKEEPAGDVPADTPVVINYEDAYQKMMAPLKDKGKTFEPKTIDEVRQLANLGLNYTKQMQALKPNLKLMRMLETNGLLDENKLNDIIDLHTKKDPGAIAKFLKENNVDPMDIDPEAGAEYKPANHRVSDEDMAFRSKLEEVSSTPLGKDTIRAIDKEWDKESKAAVYKNPVILDRIREQRENGVYAQISTEVARLRTLGDLDTDMPFLDAYKVVGDKLHEHGLLKINGVPTNQMGKAPGQGAPRNPAPPNNPASTQTGSRVIERRSEQPKKVVTNDKAARAAAPSRTAVVTQKPKMNDSSVLLMSDEEFEKAGNMRL